MITNISRKNKVPHPSVWPWPRSPGCLGTLQVFKVPGGQVLGEAPWIQNSPDRLCGPGGSPTDQPRLPVPCCSAPRQSLGNGLCRKPQARDPDILQQEQPNGFPNLAAICGLPSLANPLHIPQGPEMPRQHSGPESAQGGAWHARMSRPVSLWRTAPAAQLKGYGAGCTEGNWTCSVCLCLQVTCQEFWPSLPTASGGAPFCRVPRKPLQLFGSRDSQPAGVGAIRTAQPSPSFGTVCILGSHSGESKTQISILCSRVRTGGLCWGKG